MNSLFISLPYVYPLCPLNLNHSKMFVVADVFARYYSDKNKSTVIFPVASHFSGNTAQVAAENINEYCCGKKNEDNISVYNLYNKTYDVPEYILHSFTNADNLMNYFHNEILRELKDLNVSCDYKNAYTTQNIYFESFVRCIIEQYYKSGLIIKNENNDLAVNYDNKSWREETKNLIENTNILQPFHKKNILSAYNNLSSSWEMLRCTGYGVEYSDGLIIDPMFDSELFMIFDLFVYWKNYYNTEIIEPKKFFELLLASLKVNKNLFSDSKERLIAQGVLSSLPCDIFFAEEHLKNWICKKFFAEQKLLDPLLQTKKYQILGMGMLDKKRMSASRGHAILTNQLIKEHGRCVARLVILLTGGNISKNYNYEHNLPKQAKHMLDEFMKYWIYINSGNYEGEIVFNKDEYCLLIDKYIENGYFRRAITELLINIPAKFQYPNRKSKDNLICFFNKYLSYFLPGVL